ncbi:MAG: 50S ribosomal protein L9 [Candidatus Moranbacteria bacterium]|nr:50S ribosomal protein L9 [Candidatus Moranbacteria bacterium]
MSAQVVLQQDVNKLGRKGDIVSVKDGFARNFLLPKLKAKLATLKAVAQAEKLKQEREKEEQAKIKIYRETAKKIQGRSFVVTAKAKDQKLFGSIKTQDITDLLAEEKHDIPPQAIQLAEPIKLIGKYEIKIELPHQITSHINLEVKSDEDK